MSTDERKVQVMRHQSRTDRRLVPATSGDSDSDNFEEWTTSKRKINHKTRQVETRVSRQLLVEDGKVIADSGPQVTTRIKEDNKVEECEREKQPSKAGAKLSSALECAPAASDALASGRVLGEKREISRVSRKVREENLQYHDERFKELTGQDVHRRAIQAPHELITITDEQANAPPRGKMVHYSNKGKNYRDTDEILEVAKLAIDGSITKEVTRTKHHEEESEDEKPDEKGEAEKLRGAPTVTRSSRRHVDYVNDFDDLDTPECSSDDETGSRRARPLEARHSRREHASRQQHASPGSRRGQMGSRERERDDAAFPRYQLDPLLNSLRDEDYHKSPAHSPHSSGPLSHQHTKSGGGASLERRHKLSRTNEPASADSSDCERRHGSRHQHQHQHHSSAAAGRVHHASPARAVEIPEEYRVNKQRLMGGAGSSAGARPASPGSTMERSAGRSHRHHQHQTRIKEDASVQARLTDEEEERRSMRSQNSHEDATRHLQRQSTANSSRNYYFGQARHQRASRARSSSSSLSSLSDPKERMRTQGVRSRDSGFRSPNARHQQHHQGGDIYAVSGRKRHSASRAAKGAASPAPSLGQRSVKTTTTTYSAGLAERPLSRAGADESAPERPERGHRRAERDAPHSHEPAGRSSKRRDQHRYEVSAPPLDALSTRKDASLRQRRLDEADEQAQVVRDSLDSVSLSSLGPNATTIRVPYRGYQQHRAMEQGARPAELDAVSQSSSVLRLQDNIQNLRQRLDNIQLQRPASSGSRGTPPGDVEHFDYKPYVANVKPVPPQARHNQVIDVYNVRVIEHKSPFNNQQPIKSVNELSDTIARLELQASSGASPAPVDGARAGRAGPSEGPGAPDPMTADNNNEADFRLDDYMKYKSTPVLATGDVDEPAVSHNHNANANANNNNNNNNSYDDDDDRVSLLSSGSLRSTRTYNIRPGRVQEALTIADLSELTDSAEASGRQPGQLKRGPSAWIFDLRDNTSTTIEAPPKPKAPEPAKVNPTELAEARGGRSYYLEVAETDTNKQPESDQEQERGLKREQPSSGSSNSNHTTNTLRPRPSSIDSLYSRWSSHNALNKPAVASTSKAVARHKVAPTQKLPHANQSAANKQQKSATIVARDINSIAVAAAAKQRPAPASLGNRSKSSSCLLVSSTKPSKYSIYGGLRRADECKPVPRLSYSRAIGPKSQRQTSAQPKTPSRYLKMK